MKRSLLLTSILLAVLVSQSACEQPAIAPLQSTPAANVITVGFTVSASGIYTKPSTDQANGFQLWIQKVNESGGIRLANGDVVTFSYRSYDDASDPALAAQGYSRLIAEDQVDFLFGPYSSELTNDVVPLAETSGMLMISAGAASDATFAQSSTSTYQVYTPSSEYLLQIMEIINELDPTTTRIAILTEDDPFARAAINGILAHLQAFAFQIVYQHEYPSGTTDFSSWVEELKATQPALILAGGHSADERLLAQELARQDLAAKLVSFLSAPAEPDFGSLGISAQGILAPSQWEPNTLFTPQTMPDARMSWYGPSSAEFTVYYTDQYGEAPSYYAAGGYAAGLILQYGIETSGSTKPEIIIPTLDEAYLGTFFGSIRFDDQGRNHGAQIAHEMVIVQWLPNPNGELIKRIVWPIDLANAPILYPLP